MKTYLPTHPALILHPFVILAEASVSNYLDFFASYLAKRGLKAGHVTGRSRAPFGSGGIIMRLPAFLFPFLPPPPLLEKD